MQALKVQYFRGDYLESEHHVDALVVDSNGHEIAVWGNSQTNFFPRSSVKMLQALLLARCASADIPKARLAIACGSHRGDPEHVQVVREWLDSLGLSEKNLVCGPHAPYSQSAQKELILQKLKFSKLHNNCSGKHTGLLQVCQANKWDVQGYEEPSHPLQKALLNLFEELSGDHKLGYGIDGCGIPNYRMSLIGCAKATTYLLNPKHQDAARIIDAVTKHPEMVSGKESLNTDIMLLTKGNVVLKLGAEGTYTGIVRDKNWAFVLKVQDGAGRAAEPVLGHIFDQWDLWPKHLSPAEKADFRERFYPPVKSWSGVLAGRVVVS